MVMDKHGESSITYKNFQTQIAVWYRNSFHNYLIPDFLKNPYYCILNDVT